MKLTIEFDTEWYRVRWWWQRTRCRVFGHPGWRPPRVLTMYGSWMSGNDNRLRCVRCGAPHPDEPEPKPMKYTFVP